MSKRRKLFCEYGPIFYKISTYKQRFFRMLKDLFCKNKFSKYISHEYMPVIVKSHVSLIMRQLDGVDMRLQKNKGTNLKIACNNLNGIIISPGETFSLWKLIGNTTKAKGYLPGLTISSDKLGEEIGGGLCQLANMIHWLVLHSPLTITEFHHHTDALFPDKGRRVPFGTGASILYNYIDYRFCNNTENIFQLKLWVDEYNLNGELRSNLPTEYKYKIEEEDHYFAKEGNDYFRNSRIYRKIIQKQSKLVVDRELILINHAKVMYNHNLIPEDQIRQ